MKTIICAAILAALLNVGSATAGVITIDFDDQPVVSFVPENLVIQGFQFSPSYYYHTISYLGWNGGCGPCDQPPNQNYTGLPPDDDSSTMWVNYFGKSFSLLSLIPEASDGPPEWTVTSSNGGSFYSAPFDSTVVEFSGPEWTDITWLLFSVLTGGRVDGFDDITFGVRDGTQIPEPGTMLLIGLGLASLAITRRRRRSL